MDLALREAMFERLPAFCSALTVFCEHPDPMGKLASTKAKVRAILPDVQRMVREQAAKASVSVPVPDELAEWARSGQTPSFLSSLPSQVLEQYYEQRIASLEQQNVRFAEQRGFDSVDKALKELKKSDGFEPPQIINMERAEQEGAMILQTSHARDLLRHTPLRAMTDFKDNEFINKILLQLPRKKPDLVVGMAITHEGMSAVIRYVGPLNGRGAVKYVGIELDDEFASSGSNSGDVDGQTYFETRRPGSGIFFPAYHLCLEDSVPDTTLEQCAVDVARFIQIARDNHFHLFRIADKISSTAFSQAARELARKVAMWLEGPSKPFVLGNAICYCTTDDMSRLGGDEMDTLIRSLGTVARQVALLDLNEYKSIESKVKQPAKFKACAYCEIPALLDDLPDIWVNRWAETSTLPVAGAGNDTPGGEQQMVSSTKDVHQPRPLLVEDTNDDMEAAYPTNVGSNTGFDFKDAEQPGSFQTDSAGDIEMMDAGQAIPASGSGGEDVGRAMSTLSGDNGCELSSAQLNGAVKHSCRYAGVACSLLIKDVADQVCTACKEKQHKCRQLCRDCANIVFDERFDNNKRKRTADQVLRMLPDQCSSCIFRESTAIEDDSTDTVLEFLGGYDEDFVADSSDEDWDDEQDSDDASLGEADHDGEPQDDEAEASSNLAGSTGQAATAAQKRKRSESSPVQGSPAPTKPYQTANPPAAKPGKAQVVEIDGVVNKQSAAEYVKTCVKPKLASYNRSKKPLSKANALRAVRAEHRKMLERQQGGATLFASAIKLVNDFLQDKTEPEP